MFLFLECYCCSPGVVLGNHPPRTYSQWSHLKSIISILRKKNRFGIKGRKCICSFEQIVMHSHISTTLGKNSFPYTDYKMSGRVKFLPNQNGFSVRSIFECKFEEADVCTAFRYLQDIGISAIRSCPQYCCGQPNNKNNAWDFTPLSCFCYSKFFLSQY